MHVYVLHGISQLFEYNVHVTLHGAVYWIRFNKLNQLYMNVQYFLDNKCRFGWCRAFIDTGNTVESRFLQPSIF